MKVTPIAKTELTPEVTSLIAGTAMAAALIDENESSADHLAEFAGRACYKAWERKNPKTATTQGYLAHILDQGHFSVLEHSSVTFYVEGVSRSLLLELERHRFLSFSVESQRYVDQVKSHPEPVIPPGIKGDLLADDLHNAYSEALEWYEEFVAELGRDGITGKRAREIARAVLPNCTPVDFVVTGNLRCWRDVLGKRWHVAADNEIRLFAGAILGHLREIAPHSVQDFSDQPIDPARSESVDWVNWEKAVITTDTHTITEEQEE